VSHGDLTTGPASDGSAYQEYRLTEKGRSLYLVLVALQQWGERFLFEKGELDLLLVDRETGQPVKPLELRSQDGRILGPADLRTVSTGLETVLSSTTSEGSFPACCHSRVRRKAPAMAPAAHMLMSPYRASRRAIS
jgi:hypothetical protein